MTLLPPKIPPQKLPPLAANITTISPSPPSPQPLQKPSWTDEFLDFTSTKRASHRRSMSDSIAFLDPPRSSLQGNDVGGFDGLDDEQLMSMFSDDIIVNNHDNYQMYDSNNNNNNNNSNGNGNGNNNSDSKEQECFFLKSEPQEIIVEKDCNNNNVDDSNNRCDDNIVDPYNFDPKRIKRVLANRQSAQRSRVRKLQYISELERSVTSLETEVSVLSPRVAYLDHHRLILNVDNSALKQRIAALAQDKIFMDAHQEALKKEVERLRQVYHQQQSMKKMCNAATTTTTVTNCGNNATTVTLQPSTSDHSMGCTDKEQLMI